jgi:hypothetical protein
MYVRKFPQVWASDNDHVGFPLPPEPALDDRVKFAARYDVFSARSRLDSADVVPL